EASGTSGSTSQVLFSAFDYVNRLAIDPNNGQVILAVTRTGIQRACRCRSHRPNGSAGGGNLLWETGVPSADTGPADTERRESRAGWNVRNGCVRHVQLRDVRAGNGAD